MDLVGEFQFPHMIQQINAFNPQKPHGPPVLRERYVRLSPRYTLSTFQLPTLARCVS